MSSRNISSRPISTEELIDQVERDIHHILKDVNRTVEDLDSLRENLNQWKSYLAGQPRCDPNTGRIFDLLMFVERKIKGLERLANRKRKATDKREHR